MADKFDVSIDEFKLDKEWVDQPNFYFRYSRKLADARKLHDEAKNRLEVVKAELYRSIVSNPDMYGMTKTTEAAIASTIPTQREYQEAHQAVIEAKHHVDIYAAAVTALDHRKKALENLVSLHLAGYYAKPQARTEDREQIEELEKKTIRQRTARKPTKAKT